jgi:hypothetical protein
MLNIFWKTFSVHKSNWFLELQLLKFYYKMQNIKKLNKFTKHKDIISLAKRPTFLVLLSQKSTKNIFINTSINKKKTLSFYSKYKLNVIDTKIHIISTLTLIYMMFNRKISLTLQLSVNHIKLLQFLVNELNWVYKLIYNYKLGWTSIVINRPNYFSLKFQKKKIKSIKKSRKKALYKLKKLNVK